MAIGSVRTRALTPLYLSATVAPESGRGIGHTGNAGWRGEVGMPREHARKREWQYVLLLVSAVLTKFAHSRATVRRFGPRLVWVGDARPKPEFQSGPNSRPIIDGRPRIQLRHSIYFVKKILIQNRFGAKILDFWAGDTNATHARSERLGVCVCKYESAISHLGVITVQSVCS